MIGKRSFANMESMTAIGWIEQKKFLFLHEKNKRMRQPCRMIVVYNKTHQTKKNKFVPIWQKGKEKRK